MANGTNAVLLDAVSFSKTMYAFGPVATDANALTQPISSFNSAARRDLTSAFVQNKNPASDAAGFEEGSIHSGSDSAGEEAGNDASLLEQSLEMQTDMLERYGTSEQAKHLELFQQLRTWQAEQRVRMLREQQEQLQRLQTEQQAAEARLAAQRQNQWSGARATQSTLPAPVKSVISNKISPRLQVLRSAGLPQAIASSTLALARIRLQESISTNEGSAEAPAPIVRGRPVPQLQQTSDVEVADELSDEELKSDVASCADNSCAPLDDGVYPLPDSASEASDLQSFLQPPATNSKPSGTMRSHLSPTCRAKLDANAAKVRKPVSDDEGQDGASDHESDENIEDGSSGSIDENRNEPVVTNFDDMPVPGAIAQGRTFEQMLEDQLQKELNQHDSNSDDVASAKAHVKFLRKGEGIARFKGPVPRNSAKRKSNGVGRPATKLTSSRGNSLKSCGKPPLPSAKQNESASNRVEQKSQVKTAEKRRSGESKQIQPRSANAQNVPAIQGPVSSTPDPKRSSGSFSAVKLDDFVETRTTSGHDSIGETSYIACMQARARKDEAEVVELHEFELLEQYADDNASLISNISSVGCLRPFVTSSLQRKVSDDNPRTAPVARQNGCRQQDRAELQEDNSDSEAGDGNEDSQAENDEDAENKTLIDDMPGLPADSNSNNKNGVGCVNDENAAQQPTALQSIYRKILSSNFKPLNAASNPPKTVSFCTRSGKENKLADDRSDSGSSDDGESEEEAESRKPTSQQIIDAVKDDQLISRQGTKADQDIEGELVKKSTNDIRFDDEREWHDSSLIAAGGENRTSVGGRLSDGAAGMVTSGLADEPSGSPPTSKLAVKLFPKLKPNTKTEKKESVVAKPVSARQTSPTDASSAAQSAALREKLSQLESEIQRFRSENAALSELHKEREQVVERLRREMVEFEKQKADELQRLEEFKAEETRKLRKERKIFEQYQKAVKAGPDKKEREEIETLKSQVARLQEDLQKKEQRWTANSQRLRDRIEQLEQENTELRQEVRILEQRRLEEWKPKKSSDPLEMRNLDLNTRPAEQVQKQPAQDQRNTNQSSDSLTRPKVGAQRNNVPAAYAGQSKSEINVGKMTGPSASGGASRSLSATNVQQSAASVTKVASDDLGDVVRQRSQIPIPLTSSPLATPSADDASTDPALLGNVVRKTATKPTISSDLDVTNKPYDEIRHPDGKVERICPDGSREIIFGNGTRKQISMDGQSIIVSFFNGDIKQILPDGRVVYYYADAQTTHTTYADGLQIFQFLNGQTEKHYIDGTKEIQFPDQTIKYLFTNGSCESIFPDGTVIHVDTNGDKQLTFPNGQKEVHTKHFKRREYPDGTTKTVYVDGRQETRYSNGRVRVKDSNGCVIVDQIM